MITQLRMFLHTQDHHIGKLYVVRQGKRYDWLFTTTSVAYYVMPGDMLFCVGVNWNEYVFLTQSGVKITKGIGVFECLDDLNNVPNMPDC
jgi:hypothetical protein